MALYPETIVSLVILWGAYGFAIIDVLIREGKR